MEEWDRMMGRAVMARVLHCKDGAFLLPILAWHLVIQTRIKQYENSVTQEDRNEAHKMAGEIFYGKGERNFLLRAHYQASQYISIFMSLFHALASIVSQGSWNESKEVFSRLDSETKKLYLVRWETIITPKCWAVSQSKT
ncbi:hypothetical protein KY290_024617 [Solanum tuberosum]|uniref:Uncharacterized protein n=1 Tax=Solanum tuberosum TaxID=4113 RepID=A0ABQ7UR76_SOLTU|nr:hypothetical protein KY284_023463 [Solanum tuberosum]KAH0754347.1 hypothetical protein KY290_024617 [Solanum tuberosum]